MALFLFGIIGGGTWYLLRSNPAKSVEKLRIKIDKLLNSGKLSEWKEVTSDLEQSEGDLNDKTYRLEIARKTSDIVLDYNPKSEYDLNIRGLIEEYSGNSVEALKWYEKISKLKKPSAGNELRRARLLKNLGLNQAAKGAVSGVVDVYPFESNFQLGHLHLDTFQPLEAYKAFYRAKNNASNDDETRRVLEGMVEAINLLISSSKMKLAKLESTASAANKNQISQFQATIKKFEEERNKTLDKALELLRNIEPRSRSEFVAVQVKLFELLNSKGDTSDLENSKQVLLEAVSADDDFRYFPIYLLLGSLDLRFAYDENTSEPERKKFIQNAIAHYEKVFAFDFEGKTAKVTDIADWSFPKDMTSNQFNAEIITKICGTLLPYPEYWRILSNENSDGEKDSLEIHRRIQELMESDLKEDKLFPLESLIALSQLKNGDLQSFNQSIEGIVNNASSSESKEQRIVELATGIAGYTPEKAEVLQDLIEKKILVDLDFSDGKEKKSISKLKVAVRILNHARNSLFAQSSNATMIGTTPNRPAKSENDPFSDKILHYVSMLGENASNPAQYLYASNLMNSLVGIEETMEILKSGLSKFEDNYSIRYALALAYLELGKLGTRSESLLNYESGLKEFLRLYIAKPYKNEVLTNLLRLGGALATKESFVSTTLPEIIGEIFPKCSEESKQVLTKVLQHFLRQDFQGVIDSLPASNEAGDVRPFLNLISGISYLECATMLIREKMAEVPVISTQKVDAKDEDFKTLFARYYEQARREFKVGLSKDSSYLPFHLELFKMDLNKVKIGEEPSTELLATIERLVKEHPDVSQVHYLYATFIKKQRESSVIKNPELKDISGNITKERTVLRRAIKINPAFTDAYIALAETYVVSWRLSVGILKDHKNVYNKLGSPEFDIAISVLKSAPQSPKIFRLIAQYYEEDKKPNEALSYYKALLKLEPSSTNVSKVVQSYLLHGEFENAREWLRTIDPSTILSENFEVTKDTLIAHIASVESEASATSDLRKDDLEQSQIEQYKSIISQAEKLGEAPPLLVVNNLAYLLANRGKPEESVKLIEPVIERISKTPEANRIGIFQNIKDTYAWSLFQSGAKDKALEIYGKLCAQETKLDIHLNYAKVLFDGKMHEDALRQIDIIINSGNDEKRKIEGEARDLQKQIELAIGK